MKVQKIKIADMIIKDRSRKDLGDLSDLANSILSKGLINPITVLKTKEGKFQLIAGERRTKAMMLLQQEDIDAHILSGLDEMDLIILEAHENLKRKNLTWPEEVRTLEEMHRIQQELHGVAKQGYGQGWGLKETAQQVGRTVSAVQQDLQLAKALREHPELAKAKSKHHATKTLLQLKEDEIRRELADRRKSDSTIKGTYNVDGISGMHKFVEPESVDLVIADPPYGIDRKADDSDIWKPEDGYNDRAGHATSLIRRSAKEWYRVMKENSHLFIFFDMEHYKTVLDVLIDAGFNVFLNPIVWDKLQGSSPPQPYSFTRCYESILHAMKGKRKLKKAQFDIMEFKKVPPSEKIHSDEKPLDLIQKLIELTTEYGEVVLDSFAGSMSTGRAAIRCYRSAVLFELDKEKFDAGTRALTKEIQERENGTD